MTLSPPQVFQLAVQAGVPASAAVMATAIAQAESGLDPGAVSYTGCCFGLWQVNQSAHPQWSEQQLFDPTTNAQAMAQISANGSDWTAWDTYKNGTAQLAMPGVTAALTAAGGADALAARAGNLPGSAPGAPGSASRTGGGGSSTNPFLTVLETLLGGKTPNELVIRLLEIVGGALVMAGGLVMFGYLVFGGHVATGAGKAAGAAEGASKIASVVKKAKTAATVAAAA